MYNTCILYDIFMYLLQSAIVSYKNKEKILLKWIRCADKNYDLPF